MNCSLVVEMRQKCLEKLISNLQSRNNMDFDGGSNSTDCVTICSSIRNFLSGLDYSTESRCVIERILLDSMRVRKSNF
jgi:hypothetical protein